MSKAFALRKKGEGNERSFIHMPQSIFTVDNQAAIKNVFFLKNVLVHKKKKKLVPQLLFETIKTVLFPHNKLKQHYFEVINNTKGNRIFLHIILLTLKLNYIQSNEI